MATLADIIKNNSKLNIIDTTTDGNGYPSHLGEAIVGFESFDEALDVATREGLKVEVFTRKNGWRFWYQTGKPAYEAFQMSADYFGDDYAEFDSKVEFEYLKERISDASTPDEVFDLVEAFKKCLTAQEKASNDEMVVTYQNDYFDTIKRKTMSYDFDSREFVIGLTR